MSATAQSKQAGCAGTVHALRENVARYIALLGRKPRRAAVVMRRGPIRAGICAIAAAAVVVTMFLLDAMAVGVAQNLPLWLVARFDQITDFGNTGWLLVPITLLLVVLAAAACALPPFSQRVLTVIAVRLAFLFWAIALPGLIFTVVKRLIGRARPLVGGSTTPFLYVPLSWDMEYASLPSGHATDAFAAAMAFGALYPAARPLLWTYAVLIALSRVVLTAHFPSDVLAGAIIGVGSVFLVREWFAARRLAFAVAVDGRTRPLPGPAFSRIKKVVGQLLAS
jgi:membrane-associated phospholipid phosphatase